MITIFRGKRVWGALSTLMLFPVLTWAEDVPERVREFGMTPHDHYDLVLYEVFVDLAIIGIIFALVTLYFMFAYRRKSPDEVGRQPKLSTQAMLGWLIIPSALFLADDIFLFAKAWDLHDNYRKVPANAYEVKVTGSLWSWNYEYPNGVSIDNELVVEQGKPVLLRMTSDDVIHSHYLNRYRVTEDLMPGRVTYQWFMPDELGESVVTCREYCGLLHSNMYGTVRVLATDDFNAWMAEQVAALDTNDIKANEIAAVVSQPNADRL